MWIFSTNQSTLVLIPKIMLNIEIECDTLNIIFGIPLSSEHEGPHIPASI
jgi:hypothetical protein